MTTSSNINIFRVTGPWWGESIGKRWIPSQKLVVQSINIIFGLRLNKRLSKQSRRMWFETPSGSLWRHCDAGICVSLRFRVVAQGPLGKLSSVINKRPRTCRFSQKVKKTEEFWLNDMRCRHLSFNFLLFLSISLLCFNGRKYCLHGIPIYNSVHRKTILNTVMIRRQPMCCLLWLSLRSTGHVIAIQSYILTKRYRLLSTPKVIHTDWLLGGYPPKSFSRDTPPWTSYQIRKIVGCAFAGNAGNVFPLPKSKETAG